eukprot:TRINITY_DN2440_c0_g1_i1.p2 TRINITY_DN2440_c0_g1~~TRINITY_DN2440_c0_g1_i1.p2  ORF type:complete len:117 (-),score=39.53 TRINITY_DN2440_c0_g1_i1:134-484(-)
MNEVGRPAYSKANPGADIGTVGKALGEEWKSMSDAAKQPFQEKADLAKKEYQVAIEKYQQTAEYKQYEEAKKAYKVDQANKRKRLEGKSEPRSAKKAKASKSRSRSASRKKASAKI